MSQIISLFGSPPSPFSKLQSFHSALLWLGFIFSLSLSFSPSLENDPSLSLSLRISEMQLSATFSHHAHFSFCSEWEREREIEWRGEGERRGESEREERLEGENCCWQNKSGYINLIYCLSLSLHWADHSSKLLWPSSSSGVLFLSLTCSLSLSLSLCVFFSLLSSYEHYLVWVIELSRLRTQFSKMKSISREKEEERESRERRREREKEEKRELDPAYH